MNRNILLATILFLLIYTFSIPIVHSSNQIVEVTIESDGVVSVRMNTTVTEGINYIKLPIEPVPETINIVENDKSIPPIYYNKTLVIPIEKAGVIEIRYIANVSLYGSKATIYIGNVEVVLKIMKGVVLLSVPENISGIKTIDNTMIMRFLGPVELSYTIAKSKPVSTTTPSYILMLPWWILAVSVVGVILVLSLFISICRRHSELEHLDRDILDVLKNKGGKALQSEIMAELDIPKTTLWRHVKRLEALGYVRIEKIGRVNIIKLLK